MSMLAEPRRKTSWVLNPRNTHWTADTSKFGMRLMEKMGWSQGSGLGANAQGSTEHIAVAVRSDNRGVGFKDRAEDELIQQSDFAELLQQLGSETSLLEAPEDHSKIGEIASLEEKSQKSRSRVHYKKFTRGKDLSLYSEKDLASILGKPAPTTSAKKVKEPEAAFESDVATIGGGCMLDYFRKKMTEMRSGVKPEDAKAPEEIAEENEKNGTEVNIENNVIQQTKSKKEKKKSKKRSKDCEPEPLECDLKDKMDSEMQTETKKEKKRKRKVEKGLEDCEQVAPGWEVSETPTSEVDAKTRREEKQNRKAKKALKDCEQETVRWEVTDLTTHVDDGKSKKEKKRKARKSTVGCEHQEVVLENISLTEEIVEIKKERKRKRKKDAVCEDGDEKNKTDVKLNEQNKEVDETQASEIQLPEANEEKMSKEMRECNDQVTIESELRNSGAISGCGTKKRKEKKHKSKDSPEEPEQLTVEDKIIEVNEEVVCEVDIKKKKKKRKLNSMEVLEECGQTNVEMNIVENENSEAAGFKKEKKHKKRKRNAGKNTELQEDILAETVTVGETVVVGNIENDVSKLKKEKKHKKRKGNSEESIEMEEDMISDTKPAKRRELVDNNSDISHQMEVGEVENNTSKSKKDKKSKKIKSNLEESTKLQEELVADKFADGEKGADLNHQEETTKFICGVENSSADLIHEEETSKVGCQIEDDDSADHQEEAPNVLGEEKYANKSCEEEIEPEVVELNGKRYLNGICNFDLPCPVIDTTESVNKIQAHLRDTLEFETILGANNENFHYAGLSYQYVKLQAPLNV